jgi:hypothetical protein
MRYWWVNQNKTFKHEVAGGYLWSPRRNKKGHINPFYESMREVAPGDLVLSFQGTFIRAIGIASSYAWDCERPSEFGKAGDAWDPVGWKVSVQFNVLQNQIKPAEYIDVLRPLLPDKYSPLQEEDGHGNQLYLTWVPTGLGGKLLELIGQEGAAIAAKASDVKGEMITPLPEEREQLEQKIIHDDIQTNRTLDKTEKDALIKSRIGQGQFKDNLARIEHCCRITKVDRLEFLIASHTKPWRYSSNAERTDGENGFLLTPSIDRIFDRGFISFENNGDVIISPVAHLPSLQRMGIDTTGRVNVGGFTARQRQFLDFHRDKILKKAHVEAV